MESSTAGSFLGRHEFLVRRLHSLSGLIPVGAYMCVHLVTNASVLGGAESFQRNVDLIHSLGPVLPIVEWTFIFIPILFHAIVGVWIIRSGQSNLSSYHYVGNVRYTLQRATAWIALLFIAWHVFHMHGWIKVEPVGQMIEQAGGAQFDHERATSTAAMALRSPVAVVLYALGVLGTVFHLANGVWTMGITWGLWISPAAQRRADYVCAAFGIVLAFIGLAALGGMVTTDVDRAEAFETARHELREEFEQRQNEILEQKRAVGGAARQSSSAAAVTVAQDR